MASAHCYRYPNFGVLLNMSIARGGLLLFVVCTVACCACCVCCMTTHIRRGFCD